MELAPRKKRILPFIAFLWGLAEGSLFFIVPDVLLTFVARKDLKRALFLSLFAALGALLAGWLMLEWSRSNYQTARYAVEQVPAISMNRIQQVSAELGQQGIFAIFLGSVTGVPYKIYALEWGHLGFSWSLFFLASLLSRYVRFAASAILANTVCRTIGEKRVSSKVILIFWVLFYAAYFSFSEW
ncbi:MAG: hypothetical protein KDD62_06360 [Bdellovibrionales bacterium]|nr:hypothetical protein [Bdellovibrionales bacterium]